MTSKDLTIRHFDDTDTLLLYTDTLCIGGETVAPNLSVHYNRNEEVIEVVIYRAAKMLGSYLLSADGQTGKRSGFDRDMAITYAPETDTLRLQTGEPPYTDYTEKAVAPGLCVNFDPEGWAMGVVIERAAELLRPYLLAKSAGVA